MSEWISVKNRRPETTGIYFVYMPNNAERQYDTDVYIEPQHTWACNQTYITHWMPLPEKPESEDGVKGDCLKEVNEGKWIVHYNDIFPTESTEECSICHAEQYINGNDDNYCPNCGAKMKQKKG